MNAKYPAQKLLLLVLLASLFLTSVSQAADSTIVGNLALVSPGFISVTLHDGRVLDVRLPKSGDLAAKAITSKYKLGETVEITWRNIDPYLDKSTDNYLFVELKKIRSVSPASPEDVAKVLAALSWKSGTNLLSIPSSLAHNDLTGESAELERIRKTNLDIAAALPKFAATERASRFVRRKGASGWQLQDTVDSELVYQGVHATRQNVRINGKPTPKNGSSYWLPGINWWIGWEIGFGSELMPLFDRKCTNRFNYEGPAESRGRQLIAYTFQAPADGCFGPDLIGAPPAFYNPERSGRVLVDKDGDRIVQFEMMQGDLAKYGFPETPWRQVLSWDDVKIANSSHRLPVAGDYFLTSSNGDAWHIEVRYTNYRVFGASVDLSFPDEAAGERK